MSQESEELKDSFFDIMGFDGSENGIIKITSTGDKANFYTSSGVDIDEGDNFSSVCGNVCKASYNNSPYVQVERLSEGNFRGPRGFRLINLPEDYLITFAPDGIGTKSILIETMGSIESAACDVVAMTADDIVRNGGLPLAFTNVLDTRNIKEFREGYDAMMERLGKIAKEQKFIILNGETAELPACVGTPNIHAKTAFNWSGMMSGIYHQDKTILGNKLKVGDILVALKQDGFRSNGLSAVREAFNLQYGPDYYQTAPKEELSQAATPSIIYSRVIAEANGWYSVGFAAPVNITGIAHLSGGSFKGKLLEDMLGVNLLSAEFDNLYPIPEIVKKVVIWSQKSKKPMKSLEEMYSTWCGGQGMIVAVATQDDAQKLIEIMTKNSIDSQIAGIITETPKGEEPSIKITNIR